MKVFQRHGRAFQCNKRSQNITDGHRQNCSMYNICIASRGKYYKLIVNRNSLSAMGETGIGKASAHIRL